MCPSEGGFIQAGKQRWDTLYRDLNTLLRHAARQNTQNSQQDAAFFAAKIFVDFFQFAVTHPDFHVPAVPSDYSYLTEPFQRFTNVESRGDFEFRATPRSPPFFRPTRGSRFSDWLWRSCPRRRLRTRAF